MELSALNRRAFQFAVSQIEEAVSIRMAIPAESHKTIRCQAMRYRRRVEKRIPYVDT